MVGVTEKKRFEIAETDKIRAEELLPAKHTVEKGHKKGQEDKYKNHRQTGEYKKKNPETFIHFLTVHAYLPAGVKNHPPPAQAPVLADLILEASENLFRREA
jgi:hypothetical protein